MKQQPMRQAIWTYAIGPTNRLPARIVAVTQAGRKVYSWKNHLNVEDNHLEAATQHALDLGWSGEWQGGALPKDKGFVFVLSEPWPRFVIGNY